MDFTDIQKLKDELFQYSEDLHSSYLFYTMTCDKLVKEVEQLKAENENLKHKIESYEQAIEQVQKICLDNSTTDTAKMNLVDRDKYLLGKNRLAGKILIVTSRAGKIDV